MSEPLYLQDGTLITYAVRINGEYWPTITSIEFFERPPWVDSFSSGTPRSMFERLKWQATCTLDIGELKVHVYSSEHAEHEALGYGVIWDISIWTDSDE